MRICKRPGAAGSELRAHRAQRLPAAAPALLQLPVVSAFFK